MTERFAHMPDILEETGAVRVQKAPRYGMSPPRLPQGPKRDKCRVCGRKIRSAHHEQGSHHQAALRKA